MALRGALAGCSNAFRHGGVCTYTLYQPLQQGALADLFLPGPSPKTSSTRDSTTAVSSRLSTRLLPSTPTTLAAWKHSPPSAAHMLVLVDRPHAPEAVSDAWKRLMGPCVEAATEELAFLQGMEEVDEFTLLTLRQAVRLGLRTRVVLSATDAATGAARRLQLQVSPLRSGPRREVTHVLGVLSPADP